MYRGLGGGSGGGYPVALDRRHLLRGGSVQEIITIGEKINLTWKTYTTDFNEMLSMISVLRFHVVLFFQYDVHSITCIEHCSYYRGVRAPNFIV